MQMENVTVVNLVIVTKLKGVGGGHECLYLCRRVVWETSMERTDEGVEPAGARRRLWCDGPESDVDSSVSAEFGFREIHLRVLSHEPADTRESQKPFTETIYFFLSIKWLQAVIWTPLGRIKLHRWRQI